MSSSSADIITSINSDWALQLKTTLSDEDLVDAFAVHLNDMIVHQFPQLVTALYRIDVSEQKIRQTLKENPMADAGKIIAHLVIERQKQKLKTRELFRSRDNDIDDNERW